MKQIEDLESYEIDYLVAKAEKLDNFYLSEEKDRCIFVINNWPSIYSPTTNPAQAWPIIEREKISMFYNDDSLDLWAADIWSADKGHTISEGKTSVEAAMRAYIAHIYGNEVEFK